MTIENEEATTKSFHIRFVPADLHRKWKIVAGLLEVTMEDFAIQALQDKVDKQLAALVNLPDKNYDESGNTDNN